MSSGAGAVQFQINKNNASRGIFFQREKPKSETRKFGYKSKNLRHPIRQPDHTEELEKMQQEAEENKRKFNKENKDFIRKNRERYKPKDDAKGPPPGTTHIAPGTVTLTQDQLAALLKTLGKSGGDSKDNPLRISIDAENNKIEVEKYESDSNADRNSVSGRGHRDDDDNGSEVGIEALLNGNDDTNRAEKRKTRSQVEEKTKRSNQRSREIPEPKPSLSDPAQNSPRHGNVRSRGGDQRISQTRMSWEDAKKEAGVSHVPDVVPWRHLTVGERKRLQWARERAEVEEEYNPWGRPGAGAPTQKQPGEVEPDQGHSKQRVHSQPRHHVNASIEDKNEKSSTQKRKEELANEILKLQLEIQEAEERKQKEEERLLKDLEENSRQRNKKPSKHDGSEERNNRTKASRSKENLVEKTAASKKDKQEEDQVQIVIITKKKDKNANAEKPTLKEKSGSNGDDLDQDYVKAKATFRTSSETVDEIDGVHNKTTKFDDRAAKSKVAAKEERGDAKDYKSSRSGAELTKSRAAPTVTGRHQEAEESMFSKKEIERRKWLAELDKQREEQRMKKQMEKERDRAGVHDQWADRFIYHKTPQQVTPRVVPSGMGQDSGSHTGQPNGARVRDQHRTDARAELSSDSTGHVPPAAMRSSMVIGNGTLNETRYDNKKAEEKRKWLEELEQQREQQRQARQAQKDRERMELAGGGTWADQYPGSHQRVQQAQQQQQHHNISNNSSSNIGATAGGVSPRMVHHVEVDRPGDTQRTSSAPQQLSASVEDGSTFLRGQGVFVDPVTRKEQEEKRRIHLEYQAEIKAQIEEKERQKREERERKRREDMEEERKLHMEREKFNQQLEQEQRKLREKEEQRQKQIAVLKSAMDEAHDKALEEKTHRRLNHLEQHGHNVTHLKAALDEPETHRSRGPEKLFVAGGGEANTPRTHVYDASTVPGLGPELRTQRQQSPPPIQDLVDSARFQVPARQEQQQQKHTHFLVGQSYTKEPYIEDRVLTPSRFRDPGKPRDMPDSPRREFGTQTLELSELQNILNSLPEDIQIEYKLKVEDALREKEERARAQKGPNRKVHVKSADKGKEMTAKPPQGTGVGRASARKKKVRAVREETETAVIGPKQRPAWNQKQRKTIVKNSERDPFYQQKKEEAEARRARRERQLQYLQELNSGSIPTMQNHESRSKSRHEHCSPRRDGDSSPVDDGGNQAGRRVIRHGQRTNNRQRSQSPDILALLNDKVGGKSPHQEQSGTSKSPLRPALSTGRSSPPIPTVRHRNAAAGGDDRDPYVHANRQLKDSSSDTRYGDAGYLPANEGDFVPFMRTTEILDPARAEEPMAVSRENSRMERARRAYRDTHNPADKGRKVEIYQDREREVALKASASQNPLLNPSLVLDHPTARQDMILQQLSSLKQTLMLRQKELETHMSPGEAEGEAVRG